MIAPPVDRLAVDRHAESAIRLQCDLFISQRGEMLAHATGRVRHFNIKAELARLGLSITPDQHIAAITIDIAHAVGIVGIVTGDDVSRKDMPEPGARSIIGDPDKRRLLLLHGKFHQYFATDPLIAYRSEERRVGKECGRKDRT